MNMVLRKMVAETDVAIFGIIRFQIQLDIRCRCFTAVGTSVWHTVIGRNRKPK